MTKTKSTKRALLMSALTLLVCVSMLVGTTFAWFTDSVTSSGNKIQAGNLKVDLEVLDKETGVWKSVKENNDPIFSYELWEPGYTEVKLLKVENEGSLALKWYAKLVSKTKMSILANVIDVYVMEGATAYPADRSLAGYKNVGTLADFINTISDTTNGALLPETSATLGLAFKMQESAGNEYQNLTLGAFDIQILATQLTYEEDSFDKYYDENANFFSTWDGKAIDTSWYDASKSTFTLTSAAQLAGLAELVNNGATFVNKTVKLGADIDLANKAWTPIGNGADGAADFGGTFDGNGYMIANLNVTGTEGVGLIGFAGGAASIYNVNIVNATVTGTHWVGAVLGYGYLSANSLAGCTVENATVIAKPDDNNDNGDKAGAIAGMAINGNIYNNKAVNCTVYAYRDLGGIVGCAQAEDRNISVYDNTVENVTLTYVACDNYKDPSKTNSNANDYAGRTTGGKTVTIENNNGVAKKPVGDELTAFAGSSDDISNALTNDNVTNIVVQEGEYTLPSMSNKEGVTIEGTEGAIIGGEDASTGFGSNFGKDNTYKNLHFTGSDNGTRWTHGKGGTVTFDNCIFEGDIYGFHMDQSNGATLIFNNCTFIGFNAFAGDLVEVQFNNCTFKHSGYYGHTNIHSVGKFNDCTFGDKTSFSPAKSSAKIFVNGVEESYHHEYIGSAASLVAFAKSVNEGGDSWTNQKVSLVADIDLAGIDWVPIGQTGATEFKGIFDGQNYTIKNLSVDSAEHTDEHYSSGLFGWAESNVTIKNVKVDGATVTGNHNVAVIVGYTYSGKISNCHVSNATVVCNHANDDACGDKAGTIAGYTADEARLSDCSASNSTVKAGRDAGQLFGLAYTNSVSNCTANNVVVSATGDCNREGNINNDIIGRVNAQ